MRTSSRILIRAAVLAAAILAADWTWWLYWRGLYAWGMTKARIHVSPELFHGIWLRVSGSLVFGVLLTVVGYLILRQLPEDQSSIKRGFGVLRIYAAALIGIVLLRCLLSLLIEH
jgi:hypothetical protein